MVSIAIRNLLGPPSLRIHPPFLPVLPPITVAPWYVVLVKMDRFEKASRKGRTYAKEGGRQHVRNDNATAYLHQSMLVMLMIMLVLRPSKPCVQARYKIPATAPQTPEMRV